MQFYAPTLFVAVALTGCSLFVEKRDEFDNDAVVASEDTSTTGDSSTGAPLPTTSGGPGIPETSETTAGTQPTPDDIPGAATIEILDFAASTSKMSRAGSIVFTAEVTGPADALELQVEHPESGFTDTVMWPVGEELEYVVITSAHNGALDFTVVAHGEGEPDEASLAITIDLPPAGTLDLRWVDPGGESSTGHGLVVLPQTGTEPDDVLVLGNVGDDAMVVGELDGQNLWTTTLKPMHVHAATAQAGFIYVTGENASGKMVLRKYAKNHPNFTDFTQLWEHTYPSSRGLDVEIGPDGYVYVAGEVDAPHHEAAMWVVTDDGGAVVWPPAVFATISENDEPLASSLSSVAFIDGRVVAAGYRESDIGWLPKRAALFELQESTLNPKNTYSGTFESEKCAWVALVTSEDALFAVGWHQLDINGPLSVVFGRFGENLNSELVSPAWGGYGAGRTIAWHPSGYPVVAGSRTIEPEPYFLVQAEPWASSWIESEGVRSWANDLRVDRHGYVYATGVLDDGQASHLMLVRFHP